MHHTPTLDTERLAKLLEMTTSSFESEVVSAAKKANEFIRKAGLRWTDILNPVPVVTQPQQPDPQQPDPYEPVSDPPFVILARHIERASFCASDMSAGVIIFAT
jgi:hypothetical protein